MSIAVGKETALIIVDVQRDFCPGGSLAVPQGDQVVPVLNRYLEKCLAAGTHLFITRDWHPADHCSFKDRGGPWPPHCVQGTSGAMFHPGLVLPKDLEVVSKGTHTEEDAYSGFQGTDLERRLKALKIKSLLVGGLATDYCVKSTVLDGLKLGFEVALLKDAVRGVEVKPGDSERAVGEMTKAGAVSITFENLGDLKP